MRESDPPNETVTVAELGTRVPALIDDVARSGRRIVVEQDGVPLAVIVPPADLQRLACLDAEDREAGDVLRAMREPFRDVPAEEIARQTERIMREMRTQDRRQRERAARSA
jgi:hypothetical protein